MIIPVFANVIILCVIYILYFIITQLKKHASLNKLPGPTSLELLGVIFFNIGQHDILHYFLNLNRRYGPVIKLWMKPFSPAVVVADVDIMNKILLSKSHLGKTKMYNMLKPLLGDGLGTTSKVDRWKHDRKICSPAFQSSNIVDFLPLMKKHTDRFLAKIKDLTSDTIDMQSLLPLCTLDLSLEFITNHEHKIQENVLGIFLNAHDDALNAIFHRVRSGFLENDFLFRFSKHFNLFNNAISVIKKITADVIRNEEMHREDVHRKGTGRLHIIDILFANNFDLNSLHDQINTFITAAHSTTAQTLCFTLYELSRHPKIQQRMFEEIISFIGEEGEATNDALKEMVYLEAAINETLRLHSVIPMIERTLSSDIEIDGVHYSEGTRFIFSLVGVHTSSSYFENPNKFDPDRFLPENAHLLTKHSFVPFSLGPRNCIGKLLAMLLLKYFTVRIIQKYEILPVEGHVLEKAGIIFKSTTGTPIILKKRSY